MTYKENKTQEQRILDLLRERGSQGAFVYELTTPRPHGLGISQYNARIWGLRKKGYNITNTIPGHFVLATQDDKGSEVNPKASEPQYVFTADGRAVQV